jgi:hypothetical protein
MRDTFKDRLKHMALWEQLIPALENKEEWALKEGAKVLSRVIINHDYQQMADLLRGAVRCLQDLQDEIDQKQGE